MQKNVIIDLVHTGFNLLCGGITVHFELCRILNELGVNAKIKSQYKTQNYICNNYYDNDFPVDNNCVVIYGEMIEGNPLNAKNVVRWILAPIEVFSSMNTVNTWGKNDLVYYFNMENKFSLFPERVGSVYKLLSTLHVNPSIQNYNLEKKGTCYSLRKYHMHKDGINVMHYNDSFEITYNHSQEECIEIFNKHEYFISYDPLTFLNTIAALCGCVSIVHPIKGLTKQQWLKTTAAAEYLKRKELDNLYGIAYGVDQSEILNAFNTLHLVKEQWDDILKFNIETSVIPFLNNINNFENMENTVQNNYY